LTVSDDERQERLERAAGLRRTVAETIARVRRKTAHIGTSLPPADDDEPGEGEGEAAARDREPEAAAPAPSAPGEGVSGEGETDRSDDDGDRGQVGDVGALLERTRAIIERTRRMIDESRATVTRFHRSGREEPDAEAESDEEDERGGSPST
jgi:hypothetical protein